MRDECESEDQTDAIAVQSADQPETIQARKLRSIPFLSNEEIAQVVAPNDFGQAVSQADEQDQLLHPLENEDIVDGNNMSMASSRSNSRRGITTAMQPQYFDNQLVSFEQFFALMQRKT